MSEQITTTPAASRRPRAVRALLTTAGLVVVAIVLAVAATGSTYAFWNGAVPASGATIATGGIGLTVNDQTSYTIPGLSSTALLPGRSVVQSQPLTLKNTGDVPLSVTWSGTTYTSSALAPHLAVSLRQTTATSCTVTPAATPLPTTMNPISLDLGQTARVCVEVRLSSSAPASVQGLSSDFTAQLSGVQVRP